MFQKIALLIGIAALLFGCAGLEVYKDGELTTTTGVKIHSPKPFVLVQYTDEKDKPINISIIYLPDLANPQYVKFSKGFGTSNSTVKLTNGILTDVGAESASEPSALIEALTGGYKTIQDALTVRDARRDDGGAIELQSRESPFELYEIKFDEDGNINLVPVLEI